MKLIHSSSASAKLELGKTAGAYSDQSAEILAGILESADELFAAIDADFRFVAFNATFRREFTSIFGQAPALGQTFPEALAQFPEQQEAATDLARRTFGGEAFRIDQEVTVPGARLKVFEINLTPILDPGGKTVVVAVVARDITAKREAELKFSRLVEASPDAMVIVRGDVIEHLNAQAETMFGYAPGALLGKRLEILVPQRLREQHLRDRAAYTVAPKSRPMGIGMNLSGMRADGTEFPVEISLNALSVAEETVVAAAIRDVSARQRTESRLRQWTAELETEVSGLTARLAQSEQRWQERERSLTHAAEQYQAVFEQAAIGIAITTPDMRFVKANGCFCDMVGYTNEALQQMRFQDITPPDELEVGANLDAKVLAGALDRYTLEKRLCRKDGQPIWGAFAVSIKRDADGKPQYFVMVIEDVTRRRSIEQKLGESQMRLQLAVEIARLGFWEWTPETSETYFSLEWKQQLGIVGQEWPATYDAWQSRLHPEDRDRTVQVLNAYLQRPQGEYEVEYRMRHEDGHYHWYQSRGIAIESPPGRMTKVIGIRLDVTERKETEQRIREAGQHDPLTGLPNRALLSEYAERFLANAQRGQSELAVLFIDLDRFKEINDTYGHDAGDAVLRSVAGRLQASVRKGDVVGRLGGDEFLVILPEVNNELSATSVAEHVLAELNAPYPIADRQFTLSPSIGVALFPHDGDSPDILIRHADQAMYWAKEAGGSRIRFFTPTLTHRAETEHRLQAALQRDEFELYFQAITSLQTAQVCGAEALVRWRRGPNEVADAENFVAAAEAAGLIGELGEWVIRAACRQQREWLQLDLPPLRLAINVSPFEFRQKDFAAKLGRLLEESGADPALVQIELEERTVMQDVKAAQRTLNEMKAQGVRIALDHFGKAECGLGTLSRLPVDTLKIDASFVRALGKGRNSEGVIDSAIALGRALKLGVSATGIESMQALDFLRYHECELAQGFQLGPPMPAREFERWYREHLH
jgi:diguanylate cyclase (GGDEF)-like protein/PAS domain S-box-containing protein